VVTVEARKIILTREVLFAGVACFLIMGLVTGSEAAQEIDNRIYAGLLGKYVKNGLVDYQGFKNEDAKLDQYLKVLEGNTLYVSKISDWFEEDFNGDVVGFILKYAKGGLKDDWINKITDQEV